MNTKISLGMLAALSDELATTAGECDKNGHTSNMNAHERAFMRIHAHECDRIPLLRRNRPAYF